MESSKKRSGIKLPAFEKLARSQAPTKPQVAAKPQVARKLQAANDGTDAKHSAEKGAAIKTRQAGKMAVAEKSPEKKLGRKKQETKMASKKKMIVSTKKKVTKLSGMESETKPRRVGRPRKLDKPATTACIGQEKLESNSCEKRSQHISGKALPLTADMNRESAATITTPSSLKKERRGNLRKCGKLGEATVMLKRCCMLQKGTETTQKTKKKPKLTTNEKSSLLTADTSRDDAPTPRESANSTQQTKHESFSSRKAVQSRVTHKRPCTSLKYPESVKKKQKIAAYDKEFLATGDTSSDDTVQAPSIIYSTQRRTAGNLKSCEPTYKRVKCERGCTRTYSGTSENVRKRWMMSSYGKDLLRETDEPNHLFDRCKDGAPTIPTKRRSAQKSDEASPLCISLFNRFQALPPDSEQIEMRDKDGRRVVGVLIPYIPQLPADKGSFESSSASEEWIQFNKSKSVFIGAEEPLQKKKLLGKRHPSTQTVVGIKRKESIKKKGSKLLNHTSIKHRKKTRKEKNPLSGEGYSKRLRSSGKTAKEKESGGTKDWSLRVDTVGLLCDSPDDWPDVPTAVSTSVSTSSIEEESVESVSLSDLGFVTCSPASSGLDDETDNSVATLPRNTARDSLGATVAPETTGEESMATVASDTSGDTSVATVAQDTTKDNPGATVAPDTSGDNSVATVAPKTTRDNSTVAPDTARDNSVATVTTDTTKVNSVATVAPMIDKDNSEAPVAPILTEDNAVATVAPKSKGDSALSTVPLKTKEQTCSKRPRSLRLLERILGRKVAQDELQDMMSSQDRPKTARNKSVATVVPKRTGDNSVATVASETTGVNSFQQIFNNFVAIPDTTGNSVVIVTPETTRDSVTTVTPDTTGDNSVATVVPKTTGGKSVATVVPNTAGDKSVATVALDTTGDNSVATVVLNTTGGNSVVTVVPNTAGDKSVAKVPNTAGDNSVATVAPNTAEDNSVATVAPDTTGDNSVATVALDTTGDNSVATVAPDTTGDNSVATVVLDTTGDNSVATVAPDTTGDNSVATVVLDTTGDNSVATVVPKTTGNNSVATVVPKTTGDKSVTTVAPNTAGDKSVATVAPDKAGDNSVATAPPVMTGINQVATVATKDNAVSTVPLKMKAETPTCSKRPRSVKLLERLLGREVAQEELEESLEMLSFQNSQRQLRARSEKSSKPAVVTSEPSGSSSSKVKNPQKNQASATIDFVTAGARRSLRVNPSKTSLFQSGTSTLSDATAAASKDGDVSKNRDKPSASKKTLNVVNDISKLPLEERNSSPQQDYDGEQVRNANRASTIVDNNEDPRAEGEGRLVWAKLGSGRWWPGLTIRGSHCGQQPARQGTTWVFWFGDHKVSQVPKEKVAPFNRNFKMKCGTLSGKTYPKAVAEAIQEAASRARVSGATSWSCEEMLHWAMEGFIYDGRAVDDLFAPLPEKPLPDFIQDHLLKVRQQRRQLAKDVDSDGEARIRDSKEVRSLQKVKAGQLSIEEICLGCYTTEELLVPHPFFKGGLCPDCKEDLMEDMFAIGDDGLGLSCAVCAHGGNLLACDQTTCNRLYCTNCISDFIGPDAVDAIAESNPWHCFLCSATPAETPPTSAKTPPTSAETLPTELSITPEELPTTSHGAPTGQAEGVMTSAWEAVDTAEERADSEGQDGVTCRAPPTTRQAPPPVNLSHGLLVVKPDWKHNILQLFNVTPLHPVAPEKRKPLRVLSLFDGIGTGRLVLDELGLAVEVYYASEIDPDALKVAQVRQAGKVTPIGDVRELTIEKVAKLGRIDLLIGGPPCNELSLCNPARKGLLGGTGLLFFDYCRVKHYLQILHPDTHLFWMMENVASMPTGVKDTISRFLECQPAVWNARDFSAQIRSRNFWGNIPGLYCHPQPESSLFCAKALDKVLMPGRTAMIDQVRTVTTMSNSLMQGKDVETFPVRMGESSDTLWIPELEKMFGFPDHYTDVGNLPATRRQKLLGKAWSIPVVKHLLTPLREFFSLRVEEPRTISETP